MLIIGQTNNVLKRDGFVIIFLIKRLAGNKSFKR